MSSAVGSFLSGFAGGYSRQQDRKADREALEASARDPSWGYPTRAPGAEGAEQRAGASGGGYSGASVASSDPVATDLQPHQMAFLNAITFGEAPGGAYDVRYTPNGGAQFDLSQGHPRMFEPGPAGKSSAAGRYQFTWTTWKGLAGEDTPFTPENQDRYAWRLAEQDFARKFGGDLNTYLQQNGVTPELQSALSTTWASMSGQQSDRARVYQDSLARYTAPKAPAAAPVARSLFPSISAQ